MATRLPLVQNAGRIQQLQAGDTIFNGLELGRRNILINGNFDIWQSPGLGPVFGTNAQLNVTDMWDMQMTSGAGGVVVVAHETSVLPTIAQSGTYSGDCVNISVSTAVGSVAAGDELYLYARIEGYNWRILAQRSTTLSFWVRSNLTGIFCIALRNTSTIGTDNNSYIAEYTINSANTWEKKIIHIPASPSAASTWVYNNTGAVDVVFALVCGANFQSGPGSWGVSVTTNFGTTNQTNFLSSASNLIYFSQVQLETGDSANPFELFPWEDELKSCQRYFARTYAYGVANATVTNVGALAYRTPVAGVHAQNQTWVYPVIMRVAPTIKSFNPAGGGNTNWRNITRAADSGAFASDLIQEHSVVMQNPQISSDAVGNEIAIHLQADARIAFTAN